MRALMRAQGWASRPLLLLVAAVAAQVGCRAAGEPAAEWTLGFEELGRVGDGADPAEAFFQPAAVRVDGADNLYVLDAGNSRVQVFDSGGRYLATRGRSGSGPGELARPTGMWVFGDGDLVVADAGNARLQRFGAAGDPLPSIPLDFVPLEVVGTDQGLFILRLPPPTFVYGPEQKPLIFRTDRNGEALGGFLAPESATVGILYFLRNTLRLAPGPGGGIAVANTHVISRIRRFAATGAAEGVIDVLYKAQSLAPLGRLPSDVTEDSVDRIARTCTALEWDPTRRSYWVLAGHVDRRRDGSWVTGTELYRYHLDGSYAGSLMLPYPARALAAASDGTLWILDAEGIAHRIRLTDPEMEVLPD